MRTAEQRTNAVVVELDQAANNLSQRPAVYSEILLDPPDDSRLFVYVAEPGFILDNRFCKK
jgi:hypothetical protein